MDYAGLRDFPDVFPLNSYLTEFDGYIRVKDEDIRLRISIKNNRAEINSSWKDSRRLSIPESYLQNQTVSSLSDLNNLLFELRSKWEAQLPLKEETSENLISPACLSNLFDQIYSLGPEILEDISDDMKRVTLSIPDTKNRKHTLRINFTDKFPDNDVDIINSLPQPFKFVWKKNSTLSQLVKVFKEELEQFQLFWNICDDIDDNYCVLEPETPTRKDLRRRIALNRNVSLNITIDPLKPFSFPEFTFMGPPEETEKLDELMKSNRNLWEENVLPMENLANLLNVEFPNKKIQADKEDILQACGICYTYYLEQAIPSEACSCNQSFHKSCLLEWLSSITKSNNKFKLYSGACPYCKKSIEIRNNNYKC